MEKRCTDNGNGMISIQEKAKEEDREKLGEKEETIPPDYRLEEAKVNRLGYFFFFILIHTEFHICEKGHGSRPGILRSCFLILLTPNSIDSVPDVKLKYSQLACLVLLKVKII